MKDYYYWLPTIRTKIFLQIFDDGRLTNGQGETVDFTNTIIIMTSNLGTKDIQRADLGFGDSSKLDNYNNLSSKIIK